jgi:hypothetical protein
MKMTTGEGIGVANDVTTGVGCRSFATMKKNLQDGCSGRFLEGLWDMRGLLRVQIVGTGNQ